MNQDYAPKTALEYITCFRQLAGIVNKSLDYVENKTDWISETDKARSLGSVANAVQTVAALRGDSGVFYDARPPGLMDYQDEMYDIENQLIRRLRSLGGVY